MGLYKEYLFLKLKEYQKDLMSNDITIIEDKQ